MLDILSLFMSSMIKYYLPKCHNSAKNGSFQEILAAFSRNFLIFFEHFVMLIYLVIKIFRRRNQIIE
jgi:hypothetical protein